MAVQSVRRIALGVLLGGALACTSVFASPAFAGTKALPATANGVRTAGGKVAFEVDGEAYVPGQPVKGRHVKARAYIPRAKFAGSLTGTLVDNQATTFDVKRSNQRFLQAKSAKLVPGWNTVKLELKCKMRAGRCSHPGKLYLHQIDFLINAQPIGADRPFEWLGTYPHYSGKQLLGAAFVKARCKPVHHKPRKPKGCRCHKVAVDARSWG